MAEKEEKSAPFPWLPLITLIGAGSGILLLFPQLTSSRPGGGDPWLTGNTFDYQAVEARLWQDPLGVAVADREKDLERERTEKQRERKNEKHSVIHSVARFQELLIRKCFAKPVINPVLPAINPLLQSAIYSVDEKSCFEEQAKHIQILAVMIPGGPYVEDVERRLRSRRAVIEGLSIAGYGPEKDDEIGYFYVPWRPLEPNVVDCVRKLEAGRSEEEKHSSEIKSVIVPTRCNSKEEDANGLLVPYEWCEPADFGAKKTAFAHVLVLWLKDDAFRDAPLARLADLISWFRLKLLNTLQPLDSSPLPTFTVLGPDNSGTLYKMVMEAKENRWNDETRQCLTTTHIFSSQASASESRLLSEVPAMDEPRIPFERDCKNFLEQTVKRVQSDNGFRFDRTLLPDDLIIKTLWQELACRGVNKDDEVAIISEEDTYYARALSSTFTTPILGATPLPNVHSYTYLRGIDGKLPSDGKDENEGKDAAESGDKNARGSMRPKERTEGLNQADDIRRLANEVLDLDTTLRNNANKKTNSRGLRAVGLLGSDVYDKLELLRALRPILPGAVFVTNNLDACLFHPDEWNETHNLVVVSAHDLSLKDPSRRFQKVAPFRDSAQTALFQSTLEAMGEIKVGDPAIPKTPLIFEIGHNGTKDLRLAPDESNAVLKQFRHHLRHIALFIASGVLLLTWIWLVPRVSLNSSRAEATSSPRAGELTIEREKIIKNEKPEGTKQVEAT
jgi:hypothetical protein